MAVSVLICDDHRLFADAFGVALAGHGFNVVAVTYEPSQALAVLNDHDVEVCLIDRQFPHADGRDGIRQVLAASPATSVIMLSGSGDPHAAADALEAGAAAFASKDQGVPHIAELILRVHRGERVVPAGDTRIAGPGGRPENDLARFLTAREMEVLSRLVQGQDTARLAADMGITYATARTHIQNLLNKLGVHSKLEAVAYAMAHNLVRSPA